MGRGSAAQSRKRYQGTPSSGRSTAKTSVATPSSIGVSPSCQGQGIGGALLAPVLQQADNEGMFCSLETFEEKNLSFYQHHGFQVVVTAIEPQSQLRFWAMRRSPCTSS